MTSTAMVASVGDARQYPKSRQMAAAIGITPKQHSFADRDRLLGISKRGDVYLRTLMIHGARAVVARAKHKDDRLSRWVTNIANKTAHMARAMLRNETDYDPDFALR
jgi:transposase